MATFTVTNTANSGAGSLREIIANAQSGDTIKFASSLANKKIVLTSGEISVLKAVTIDGSDAPNLTISGNNQSRVFNIGDRPNRINVTIKNLTFANGRAVAGTLDDKNFADGGAIRIHDFSDLVVENSNFKNNVAERGGAIRVNYGGSLTVRNSNFDGNDGSIANDGFSAGAIATNGSNGEPGFDPGNGFLKIENSTFTNNKGYSGGAVYSLLGPLTIEDSVFKNNESNAHGGAIFTDGADKSNNDGKGGEIIIRGTTIEGNKTKGQGGGAMLWTYESDRVLIENSKIVGNSTTYGGPYNESKGGGMRIHGNLTVRNSTFANNTTDQQGGALWLDKGAVIENSTFSGNKAKVDQGGAITMNTPDGTPVKITNSTFVNNSSGRDAGTIWVHGGNSDDITLTNNIFAGGTAGVTKQGNMNRQLKDGGGNFVETVPGDRGPKVTATAEYVDDLGLSDTLEVLGNDLMHLLEKVSPAVNGGTKIGATTTDQRGVTRDSQPDAGAFEFVPVANITPIKTPNPLEPATPKPEPATPKSSIRYEAEDLTLQEYQVESMAEAGASGGKQIALKVMGGKGSAKGTFDGEAGTYQVKVGYYDENDGVSSATVTVDGQSKSFKFDRDLPAGIARPNTKTSLITHSAIELKPGDNFEIQGKRHKGELARFDYIEFTKVDEAMTPVDSFINSQKKLIDLRNIDLNDDRKTDKKVSVILENIETETSSSAGLYKVANTDGAVRDPMTDKLIYPNDANYAQVALKQRVQGLEMNQNTDKLVKQLDGGALYAPYLVVDGTARELLKDPSGNLQPLFSYGGANPDKRSHVKMLDNNQFGFEDQLNAKSSDFNDFTFEASLQRNSK
jgi:hypothetical protein